MCVRDKSTLVVGVKPVYVVREFAYGQGNEHHEGLELRRKCQSYVSLQLRGSVPDPLVYNASIV